MFTFFGKIFTSTVIAISALFGGHPNVAPAAPVKEQQESTSANATAKVVHSAQASGESNTPAFTQTPSSASALPIKQTPTTVKDSQPTQPDSQQDPSEMCEEGYGKYATWSETLNSCTCVEGYDVSTDGKTCVKIQTVQPVQQPDLSINESACNTAVANLEKFQKVSAGLMSPAGGTTAIAEGNAANYTRQYNAELPVYQLVADAACKIPTTNQECQVSIEKFNTMLAKSYLGEGNAGFAYLQFPTYQTEIYYACQ